MQPQKKREKRKFFRPPESARLFPRRRNNGPSTAWGSKVFSIMKLFRVSPARTLMASRKSQLHQQVERWQNKQAKKQARAGARA